MHTRSNEDDDFADEDTWPGDDTPVPSGKEEPRYELLWVEEPGMGMVLRVRIVVDETKR